MSMHPQKIDIEDYITNEQFKHLADCVEGNLGNMVAYGVFAYSDWLVFTTVRYLEKTEGFRDLHHIAKFLGLDHLTREKDEKKQIEDIYMIVSELEFRKLYPEKKEQ